jgi:transposase
VPDEVTNDAENQQLKAQNELLKRENALLKEKIDLLIRRIFGVKSEKLDPRQLELLLSQAEEGTGLGKAEASAPTEAEPIIEGLKAASRDKRKTERRERESHQLALMAWNGRE